MFSFLENLIMNKGQKPSNSTDQTGLSKDPSQLL